MSRAQKIPPAVARCGMTLVEMLSAMAVISIVATASAGLVSIMLRTDRELADQEQLEEEGLYLMGLVRYELQTSTQVMIPNSTLPQSTILAYSAGGDNGSYYFSDPLFPLLTGLGSSSGSAGNSGSNGLLSQIIGGLLGTVFNVVDSGAEDLTDINNETIVTAAAGQLLQEAPLLSTTRILCSDATDFHAVFSPPDSSHSPSYHVYLTLTSASGRTFSLDEVIFACNMTEPYGLRVR